MMPIDFIECFNVPSSFYQVYYINRLEPRLKEYLAKDVEITNDLVKGIRPGTKYPTKVIYSGNKTIVFWNDKTKTIASCGDGDQYDPYAGFCAAVVKKLYGSTSRTKKMLKKISIDKRAVAEKTDP